MMIGGMFIGLILVLCLAYFIFIKAWKQEIVAFKIIGFVLVGLLILTVLCAPVCMMMGGRCGNNNKGCVGSMDCGMGNGRKVTIRTGQESGCCGIGGPNMMWFNGNGPQAGGCPMMDNGRVDITVTNPNGTGMNPPTTSTDKNNPQAGTSTKPGDKVTTTFEMPIWQRTVEFLKGNDANIKTFVDKVKTDPDLLKKLKDALSK